MEKELLPLVQEKLEQHKKLCASKGLTFRVTSTYRSNQEQDKLYAQGRTAPGKVVTNAKAGYSFHNHRVAYDVVPILNGQAVYDVAVLSAIGFYGKQCGLEWGGDWKSFPDNPHFQLTLGYDLSDFIAGKVDMSKFGAKTSPQSISALPEHVRVLLQAAKDFQVKEGLLDFAGEQNLSKIKIGDKTLQALKKYQS